MSSVIIAAINTVGRKLNYYGYPAIFQRLHYLHKQLKDTSILVELVKISGHSGIHGNEIADREARDVARNISLGKIPAS